LQDRKHQIFEISELQFNCSSKKT